MVDLLLEVVNGVSKSNELSLDVGDQTIKFGEEKFVKFDSLVLSVSLVGEGKVELVFNTLENVEDVLDKVLVGLSFWGFLNHLSEEVEDSGISVGKTLFFLWGESFQFQ